MSDEVHQRFIDDYVKEERDRCAALAKALHTEPDFLLHCIEYWIRPGEIETRRARFAEMQPVDDIEDLM